MVLWKDKIDNSLASYQEKEKSIRSEMKVEMLQLIQQKHKESWDYNEQLYTNKKDNTKENK